jgi:hypothetical protein
MDTKMTARPRLELTWVEVPDGRGGSRLEMRWSVRQPVAVPRTPNAA